MSRLGSLAVIAAAMGAGWDMPFEWRMAPGRRRTDTGAHVPGSGGTFRAPRKTGRNSPCPCGSGLKYKHCRLMGLCKGEL